MKLVASLLWALVFFLVFTPGAWVYRQARPDPLRLRRTDQSLWTPRPGSFRPMTSRL